MISSKISDQNKPQLQKFETICADSQAQLVFYFSIKAQVHGRLIVTNYRFIFYNQQRTFFNIPLGYINKCQRSLDQSNCSIIQISLKYGPSFKFRYPQSRFTNSMTILSIFTKLTAVGSVFALQYTSAINNPNNQQDEKFKIDYLQNLTCGEWSPLEQKLTEQESKQMNVFDNKQHKYFPTYPQNFIVPIPYIAKRQQNDRLVLLSYTYELTIYVSKEKQVQGSQNNNQHSQHHNHHEKNSQKNINDKKNQMKKKVYLWRTGPGRTDPSQQSWVPKASMRQNHQIIQVKNKGIGSNKNIVNKRVIQLDSPSMLRQSIYKVFLVSCFSSNQSQKYLQAMNSSRWFQQISILLTQSDFIRDRMKKQNGVTLLCDSDIRGAQIAALVQIMLQSDFRTFRGFQYLMEKQFLQFGNGTFKGYGSKKQKDKDQQKGLAIIQFLDCIYQLTLIYPLSFQFNEKYLIFLASNVYSNKYGNFLYTTKSLHDNSRGQIQRCPSIWRYAQRNFQKYRNCYYVDPKDSDMHQLKEQTPVKNVCLWQGFFLNILNSLPIREDHISRHEQIYKKHLQIRRQTQDLRKKINQQHVSITQKKKILKQLKQAQLQ